MTLDLSSAARPIEPSELPGAIGFWRRDIASGNRTETTDDLLLQAAELEMEVYDLIEQGEIVGARRRLRHANAVLRAADHEGLFDTPREGEDERPQFLTDLDVEQLPALEFLVDGLIPIGANTEIHGPPGCGKSLWALGIACSLVSGRGFCGHAVRRGAVVYVVGEGLAGLGARLRAWKSEYGPTGGPGLYFRNGPVQLLEQLDVTRFIAAVKALPTKPALIVLDTLARCMVGGDENSAKDMGIAIASIDKIRHATGAAVLIVHHTRKDGESERGSTALRGAVDAMFSLKNEGGRLTLSCEKQKDAAEFSAIPLQIKPIADSCTLITLRNAGEFSVESFSKLHRQALETLARDFLADGASCSAWMKASRIKESTFYKIRSDLVRTGYVQPDSPRKRPTYTVTEKGAELIALNSQETLAKLSGSSDYKLPPRGAPKKEPPGESNGQLAAWPAA